LDLLALVLRPDEARRDEVAGAGYGFIDVYDTDGNLVRRFASQGALNAPWGLALAPAGFGPFGGALLVGNFGDGHINAYDPESGAYLGPLADDNGIPITVSGLWALTFGNGHAGGASDTLFFTAGVDDEEHGLFGAIQAPQRRGADTAGAGTFDPLAPGEPRDYPLPPRGGPALQDRDEDARLAIAVLLPLKESSLALIPTLSTVPQPRARVEAPAPAAKNTQNNSLALNAFLDLNAAQTLPAKPARWQRPDTNRDALGARRSPSAGGEAGAESLLAEPHIENRDAQSSAEPSPESPRPSGQGDKVLARIRSEGRPESAGDRTAGNEGVETHDRGSWTELLNRLLVTVSISWVAVSISVVWGYLQRPQSKSRQLSGKDAALPV
ncbi:MAG: TIGR03118 family protein, partial [Gemmataceae bacterium]|nr:TIGR03118 family protein [Gemmataceae bacterium]